MQCLEVWNAKVKKKKKKICLHFFSVFFFFISSSVYSLVILFLFSYLVSIFLFSTCLFRHLLSFYVFFMLIIKAVFLLRSFLEFLLLSVKRNKVNCCHNVLCLFQEFLPSACWHFIQMIFFLVSLLCQKNLPNGPHPTVSCYFF